MNCPTCGHHMREQVKEISVYICEHPACPERGKPKHMQEKPKHEVCATGAQRANIYPRAGVCGHQVRIDLIFNNDVGLRRLAQTFGEGVVKYGIHNWKKGFPESVLISHAMEHIRLHFIGDTSEDHLAHACWNIFILMWVQEKMPALMDLTRPELQGTTEVANG